MKKNGLLLTTTLILASTLAPLLILAPSTSANGPYNWQVAVSGRGTLFPPVCEKVFGQTQCDFKVEGWCGFSGTSSGTGDCSLNRYIHSPSGDLSCETKFDITQWTAGPSKQPGPNDFIIESGTVTVSPASSTATCVELLAVAGGYHVAPTGTPGVLTISAPSDTHFPDSPGHYTVGAGPVNWAVFNLQVTENPSQ